MSSRSTVFTSRANGSISAVYTNKQPIVNEKQCGMEFLEILQGGASSDEHWVGIFCRKKNRLNINEDTAVRAYLKY